MADWIAGELRALGLLGAVAAGRGGPRQRPRRRGAGTGGGKTLMLNGHMDTSYSGREPWSRGVEGFQPVGVERDGRICGLGISNMKGALACYLAAVAALRDEAAARRRGRRGRLRRDREDAVRRRAGRRSTGATRPARATSSRTAASRTCACSASRRRARSCSATSARCGCASASAGTSSTPRSARAARTRCCAWASCSTPIREWCEALGARRRRTPTAACRRSRPSARSAAASSWRLSRTPQRTSVFLDVRVPPTKPMAEARREVARPRPRAAAGASGLGRRRRGLRDRAGRRDRRGARARGRDRRGARGGLRRAARAAT